MIETEAANQIIHGQLLGESNYRVAVKIVIVGHAYLPIPVQDELVYVSDAQGVQVAWPQELVVLDDDDETVKILTFTFLIHCIN